MTYRVWKQLSPNIFFRFEHAFLRKVADGKKKRERVNIMGPHKHKRLNNGRGRWRGPELNSTLLH